MFWKLVKSKEIVSQAPGVLISRSTSLLPEVALSNCMMIDLLPAGAQTSKLNCGLEEISIKPGATAANVENAETPLVYFPTFVEVFTPVASGLSITANLPWINSC